ncbi:MAG: MBL fold metallo-hydrolase [Candidatus Micrarchaeota archaeon]|nr:MBL fold metallo-hydrolase [Candidatus Micrarchaeota archaeon]
MKLVFHGACREIGRSCIEIQEGGSRVLLDAGMKVHDHAEPVRVSGPFDAVILSHAHLDHSGALPTLQRHRPVPVYCTFPTVPLATLLLEDSEKVAMKRGHTPHFSAREMKALEKNTIPVPYRNEYEIAEEASFSFSDAGHIPGSAITAFHGSEKTLVYTGDYKLSPTRLHAGADLPKAADVLVTESTYSEKELPDRKKLERDFCDGVRDVVESGLTALIPCFAVGRTQEILQVLEAGGITGAWIQGMGTKVCGILSDYPSYISSPRALAKALDESRFIETRKQARKVLEEPGVIIATAGMLDGGPALGYLIELNKTGKGKVFLTGFQVPGTNGRRLLEEGVVKTERGRLKINIAAEFYNFSAHSSRDDLFKTVERLSPEKVFCIHGDEPACIAFAEELREKGFEARAPQAGEAFEA